MKASLIIEKIIHWNLKFHIYIGLFLLLSIMFFSITGLMLNHSQWKFTSFWKERKESKFITPVIIPVNLDSASILQYYMKQLKISGEISNVKMTPDSLNFRVLKPGTINDIHVDYKNSTSVRKEIAFNWLGKIRMLHTFNGPVKVNPDARPNWLGTKSWILFMDITAIGMIILSLSSWIMWYKIRKKYSAGLLILILGIIGALVFTYLLRIVN